MSEGNFLNCNTTNTWTCAQAANSSFVWSNTLISNKWRFSWLPEHKVWLKNTSKIWYWVNELSSCWWSSLISWGWILHWVRDTSCYLTVDITLLKQRKRTCNMHVLLSVHSSLFVCIVYAVYCMRLFPCIPLFCLFVHVFLSLWALSATEASVSPGYRTIQILSNLKGFSKPLNSWWTLFILLFCCCFSL